MRAQIRELIRPATMIAAVLLSVSPSAAEGLAKDFVTHSNQEHHHVAHSNQESPVAQCMPPANRLPGPELLVDRVAAARFWWTENVPLWANEGSLLDADATGPADTDIGLRTDELPGRGPGRGGIGASFRPPAGPVVPAPGGLGLLAAAAVAGRGRRRRAPCA